MPGQKERSQRGRRENNAQRDRRPRDKRSGGRRERDGYDQHETPRREKGSRAKRDRMLIAGFDDDRRAPPNRNYQDMNMQQLESRRENEYEQQEEALDAIHQGVIGLKNHAININDEVVQQNVMLDDLGENMDLAQNELAKATEKARKANMKKAKICKLYCCIVILLVALIGLLAQ